MSCLGGTMTIKRCIYVILMLSLCACAERQSQWAPAGAHEVLPTDQVIADWPQGWMIYRPVESDDLAVKGGVLLDATRDGFDLQTIRLIRRPFDAELSHTQELLLAGMVPQAAVNMVLEEIRADPTIIDLRVIENGPAMLAGAPGFRLNFSYRNRSGLPRQSLVYGCIDKGDLIILSYDAPRRHYFSQDLASFEAVRKSLRRKA